MPDNRENRLNDLEDLEELDPLEILERKRLWLQAELEKVEAAIKAYKHASRGGRGKPRAGHSEETKRKISEAMKRVHAERRNQGKE